MTTPPPFCLMAVSAEVRNFLGKDGKIGSFWVSVIFSSLFFSSCFDFGISCLFFFNFGHLKIDYWSTLCDRGLSWFDVMGMSAKEVKFFNRFNCWINYIFRGIILASQRCRRRKMVPTPSTKAEEAEDGEGNHLCMKSSLIYSLAQPTEEDRHC